MPYKHQVIPLQAHEGNETAEQALHSIVDGFKRWLGQRLHRHGFGRFSLGSIEQQIVKIRLQGHLRTVGKCYWLRHKVPHSTAS